MRHCPLVVVLAGLLPLWAWGGSEPLYDDNAVLALELTGPISTVLKQKRKRQELPFTLIADRTRHAVQVRTRGKSRLRVCDFPPLRVRFSPADTHGTVFQNQDTVKMVTHCKNSARAQADVLQEFAAYRIFNLLSDISYQVRLVHVKYTDSLGKKQATQRYGFLIESHEALAERIGGQVVRAPGVSLKSLDAGHLARVFVFQYLIGNTDWSLVKDAEDDACCHNGRLIQIGSTRFYVPYDFDLAGLVNARYAYPDPSLRIRKVTQRLYRGFCMPIESVQQALAEVIAHKSTTLQIAASLPSLTPADSKEMTGFLNAFYRQAENPAGVLDLFQRTCLHPTRG